MKKFLWSSLAIAIATCILRPLRDPDLWLHIVVGRWILANQRLPTVDYWNLFGAGTPWRAYSWTNEIVFAAAERLGGLQGLLALNLALLLLLVLALMYVFGRISGRAASGTFLGALAALGCYWHAALRPQTTAWILFTGVIFICEQVRRGGWRTLRGVELALLMGLWANSHVSTVIGLGTIGIWLLGEQKSVLGRSLAWAAAGSLVTPYWGGEWLTALQMAGHPAQFRLVTELKPATVLEYWSWPLLVASALFIHLYHHKPQTFSPSTLCLWALAVIGSLAVLRFIPFTVILTCALSARALREGAMTPWPLAQRLQQRWQRLQTVPLLEGGVSALLLCLAAARLAQVREQPLDEAVIPRSAVDFMEANALPHPVLNSFGQGNYLIYRYSNDRGEIEHRVPIDGRTEVNTHEVWEKFSAAFLGTDRWRDFIALVRPATIIWPTTSPFVRLLMAADEWCLVYQDGTLAGTSVLVRRAVWEEREEDLPSLNCHG